MLDKIMAGHNKWSKVKHIKGAADKKKSKVFTKILREIEVATRLFGGDIKSNPRLRDAVVEARKANMLKDNIDRAIKRGLGEMDGKSYESITYEGYGPGGVAMLIECLTDNKNRTVSELRTLFSKNNGALGESGSVAWMFEKKGILNIAHQVIDEATLMDLALPLGAEELDKKDDQWEIIVPPTQYAPLIEVLEKRSIPLQSSQLVLVPKTLTSITQDSAQVFLKFIDLLEDLDDVQNVFSNADIPLEL